LRDGYLARLLLWLRKSLLNPLLDPSHHRVLYFCRRILDLESGRRD